MERVAKLMTPPHNYAVVHLPERKFPGVVVQGDSLHSLLNFVRRAMVETDPDERLAELEYVEETLSGALEGYKKVLAQAGMELPFSEGHQ
jgi:hypothetical protein